MSDFVIGIDTGGTYTDGVLLDHHSREIITTVKTLTTKHDLRLCILDTLDALVPEDPSAIKLVSISTTLATNAIAEGKRKPSALFLLGYDEELIKEFNFAAQLGTSWFYFIQGGHDLEGKPQSKLDKAALIDSAKQIKDRVDAVAISGYFSPLNTAHEEQAGRLLAEELQLPYVLGSQLSSKLNSIKRATTAALNASLLSPLNAFIESIEESIKQRGIISPLMIMHSDGSLMEAERVKAYPIETVHSGPAASTVGARFLSGLDKALVIDIGGTTTDIAIIDRGHVKVSEEGAKVGQFNTAVRAADVRSFGLGGDSAIWLDTEDQIRIGPERVVPISYLAYQYPHIRTYLDLLPKTFKAGRISMADLEFWYLIREPKQLADNSRTRRVIKLLRARPLPLPNILEKLELLHPMQFDGQRLIREEIVGRASLTPTDLFHLTGEFSPWDNEAAAVAAEIISRLTDLSVEALVQSVKNRMAEKIVEEIVEYITAQTLDRYPSYVPLHDLGAWLFEENIEKSNPYLGSQIRLKMPIVGIGAPAGLLLPRVAELLHTELVLPQHYEVANAIGAVVGSVIVNKEAWIYPKLRNLFPVGCIVQIKDHRRVFPTCDEAIAYAEELLKEQAQASLEQAGVQVSEITTAKLPEGAESFRIRVTAIGNPMI